MNSSINNTDCSLKAYANNFVTEFNSCLQNIPPMFGEGESDCLVRAALQALKNMKTHCSARPKCTPEGYVDAVFEELDVKKKVLKVDFAQVEDNIPKSLNKEFPSPEVLLISAASCLAGGFVGGVGGAAATPAFPLVGGTVGLVQGCKRGTQIGLGIYGLWKVVVKVGGVYKTTNTTIKVLAKHSQACEAKPLMIEPSKNSSSSRIPSISSNKPVSKTVSQEKPKPNHPELPPKQNALPVPAPKTNTPPQQFVKPAISSTPTAKSTQPFEWIDIDQAAKKIVEFAGDLTGVSFCMNEAKELKALFVNVLSDSSNAPDLLVRQFIKEPEKLFQKILSSPKDFINNSQAFINDPSLAGALGIVGTAFSVVSLANEVLPIITVLTRKGLKNPLQLPVTLSKEIVNMTVKKIVAVAKLAQGLIRNPLKTGKELIKGLIQAPKQLCTNIKNLFGDDKRKAKRKAKKLKRLQEAYKKQILVEQERQKQAIFEIVPICYKLARHHWMIKEENTPVDLYFNHLVTDWKNALKNKQFQKDFVSFIQKVSLQLNRGELSTLARLCPLAHLKEPTPPLIVSLAITQLASTTLQLACEIKSFEREVEQYKNNVSSLSKTISCYENDYNKRTPPPTLIGTKTKEQLAEQLRKGLQDKDKRDAALKAFSSLKLTEKS